MAGKSHIPLDVDLLKSLYFEQKKTTREIAKIVGASPKTVRRRLAVFGEKLRPPGPDHHMILKDRDWLYTQYVTLGKTSTEIAAEIGSGCRTVVTWLEQHEIKRRVRGNPKGRVFGPEVRQNMSAAQKGRNKGSDNPNWRGGLIHPDLRLRSSHQTREWSKEVRARDGHKCVECGATGRLHAHHIKPWKSHPELRWDLANGATLCPPCHQKAHGWKFSAWAYHGESRTSAEQA